MTTLREELVKKGMIPEADPASTWRERALAGIEAAIRADQAAKSAAEIDELKDGVKHLIATSVADHERFRAKIAKADALRDAIGQFADNVEWSTDDFEIVEDAMGAYDAAAPTPDAATDDELSDLLAEDEMIAWVMQYVKDHAHQYAAREGDTPERRAAVMHIRSVREWDRKQATPEPITQCFACGGTGQMPSLYEGRTVDCARCFGAGVDVPPAPTDDDAPDAWLERVTPKPGTFGDHERRLFVVEKKLGMHPDHGPKWASFQPEPVSPVDALDRLGVEVFGKVPEVLEEYLAPTDAEPINPLATYKRLDDHERRLNEYDELGSKLTRRLDMFREMVDDHERRLAELAAGYAGAAYRLDNQWRRMDDHWAKMEDRERRISDLTESNNNLLDNQQIHASAIAELAERIRITTSMVQGLLDGDADRIAKMEHRLDEVGQRAQFAVDMHHGQGSVIGELRGKVERLTEAVEVSQELTGERLTALEAAPARPVVTETVVNEVTTDMMKNARKVLEDRTGISIKFETIRVALEAAMLAAKPGSLVASGEGK